MCCVPDVELPQFQLHYNYMPQRLSKKSQIHLANAKHFIFWSRIFYPSSSTENNSRFLPNWLCNILPMLNFK